jgi:protocatechuate 3,4-dioxygenase beta subunit
LHFIKIYNTLHILPFQKKFTFMKRRTFIKDTALSVVAVSTCGFVHFDGYRYIGDCETTTDILGPFYRPNSPVRNNLIIKGKAGTPVELTGTIRHNDCKTAYPKAKIELWHCDGDGVYDNSSSEYRCRGTTYSDENGHYSFKTILPVPYDTGGGHIRPAHFHLMFSAGGSQPLVTQVYFTGDSHISKDPSASSPAAKNRILSVQNRSDGTKKVLFDVGMADTLAAETAVIDKLTGVYIDEKDKTRKIELFKKNNLLWMKNEVYGENFEYIGNNTFEYPAMPAAYETKLHFEIMPSGSIILTFNYVDHDLVKYTSVSVKA